MRTLPRRPLLIAAATASVFAPLALLPANAKAQDSACQAVAAPNGKPFGKRFGKLLGRAGLAALTGRNAAASAAADAAARDTVDTARENAEAAAQSVGCDRDADKDDAASNAEARYARPNDIPVPRRIADENKAFDEFGKVECTGCEGGRRYDSWANQFFAAETRTLKGGWAAKLAGMEAGRSISWQGSESYGTITARGDDRVGGFDCKRFDWSLEKGDAIARRTGLVCWGKASPYSASESWVEVY